MPELDTIDHVHVYATHRSNAEVWYRRVFGFSRVPELEHWASSDGPLFLSNLSRTVSIALFEAAPQASRATIGFRVDGENFLKWRGHLKALLESPIQVVDHGLSWSMYFTDLDANPFEITSYDYNCLKSKLHDTHSV